MEIKGDFIVRGSYIDIHDNEVVNLSVDKAQVKIGENDNIVNEPTQSELPDVLKSEKALVLWKKAQDAGWIDERFHPLVSRTKAALLAERMSGLLGIQNKWKVFESLWGRNNMRGDYNDALGQKQSLAFQDKLKSILC
ncbi:MAG: hypothetical protein IJK87_09025 [Prevotella sp.]|nr:hypothetical protein [Prevotella sp.]